MFNCELCLPAVKRKQTEPSLRTSHYHWLAKRETADWKSGVGMQRESHLRGSWLPETTGGGGKGSTDGQG